MTLFQVFDSSWAKKEMTNPEVVMENLRYFRAGDIDGLEPLIAAEPGR